MPSISDIKDAMIKGFQPGQAAGLNATIQFDLGADGQFYVVIADGTADAHEGKADSANMTLISTAEDYFNVATGKLNPMQAFMSGKIKVTGDMGLAMKLQSMFKAS